ncbi:MAG: ABC transporter ATP-binding protein, partial [Beijerinckiaceae bacterium]
MTDAASFLSIDDATRRFGGVTAVDGVSLGIRKGEFFSLLGPSGCGKTTLMRMIAGFEQPDRGRILLDGADITGDPAHLRPINMMFQSYALFPHLTVAGNIAFGLRQMGMSGTELDARVAEMIRLTQLDGLGGRKPAALSGGQKQRVALARALARGPKVLLLDEPLAALDRKLRKETQSELKRLQADSGATFIVVTHDQEEAMALSDRIAVMSRGRIVQIGSPAEIYDYPANRFTASFIGEINMVPAAMQPDGRWRIKGIAEPLALAAASSAASGEAFLALRPERMRLSAAGSDRTRGWPVTVRERTLLGPAAVLTLAGPEDMVLQVFAPATDPAFALAPGSAAT